MLRIKENFIKHFRFLSNNDLKTICEIERQCKRLSKDKEIIIANLQARKYFGSKIFETGGQECR